MYFMPCIGSDNRFDFKFARYECRYILNKIINAKIVQRIIFYMRYFSVSIIILYKNSNKPFTQRRHCGDCHRADCKHRSYYRRSKS